ncbi:hypothetical protein MML48_2g00013707 [Holotrichia oblita]|uniref:Uncharacterized protein n=1 Tax=Holotrichia oblita TaxID=644536 RepID=A0ACB9TMR1_HOLOL|nr:hypothetical protein MML48_2g00013707 [Holotrichia oblita]
MASYHTVLRRSLKSYRKVGFELILETAVVNSLLVYNTCADTKLSITEFRRELAYSLVQPPEKFNLTKKRIHTFTKPEGPGRKRRKPCKGCWQNLKVCSLGYRDIVKEVRRVISFCSDCPGQPGY